jgi:hypothetical protein
LSGVPSSERSQPEISGATLKRRWRLIADSRLIAYDFINQGGQLVVLPDPVEHALVVLVPPVRDIGIVQQGLEPAERDALTLLGVEPHGDGCRLDGLRISARMAGIAPPTMSKTPPLYWR